MHAVAWNDYLCPWAYLGRDRSHLLRDLGVTVTQLPYELHPELPPEGRDVRPHSRLASVFDLIGDECAQLDIPFRAPTHVPNTRHALEVSEVVRVHAAEHFVALDEGLARAYWVDGLDLGDRRVVEQIVATAGASLDDVRELVADGVGTSGVEASMAEARDHGVTATPAWWVDDRLLIPGAQPRETIARWVTRLQERPAAGTSPHL